MKLNKSEATYAVGLVGAALEKVTLALAELDLHTQFAAAMAPTNPLVVARRYLDQARIDLNALAALAELYASLDESA